jgi:tripartite-type tricarboxylate transporter receptor subunit TctC
MATSGELEEQLRELRTSLDALPDVAEPPKSTLRILGSARSEQPWNTFLAYFLDPDQPHGFEIDLLTSFFDRVQQEADPSFEYYHRHLENIEVETEVTSPDNNRPDVVLRVPGDWFLCIESKVDSTEGNQQTTRYVEDIHIGSEEKATYSDGGHHYVFLSKKYAPDSNTGEFGDLYWRHVVESFETVIDRRVPKLQIPNIITNDCFCLFAMSDTSPRRRTFLKSVGGTASVVALAGCQGGNGSDGSDGEGEGGSGDDGSTDGSDGDDTEGSGDSGLPNEIEMICPWSSGGGTDRTARQLASLAGEQSAGSFFVSNVTGGSGSAGFRRIAAADPDGSTVGVLTVEVCTISHLGISDITPDDYKAVMQYNFDPASLTVHEDAPYDTIEGFVEYAQDADEQIQISNSGIGAIWHLAGARFAQAAGIQDQVNHVGYDGGAPATTAVVNGEVEATTASAAEVATQVQDGPLKILGVMGEEPVNIFPDTPIFQDADYDIIVGAWRGLGVPAETPDETVSALHDVYKTVYDSDDFKEFMNNNGFGLVYRGSEDFSEFMDQQNGEFEELIANLDLEE